MPAGRSVVVVVVSVAVEVVVVVVVMVMVVTDVVVVVQRVLPFLARTNSLRALMLVTPPKFSAVAAKEAVV